MTKSFAEVAEKMPVAARELLGDALHRAKHKGHPWVACDDPERVYDKMIPRFLGTLKASPEARAVLVRFLAETPSGDHPENVCGRCGGPNLGSWHAPSPLWNAVMRGPDDLEGRWSIICPHCFAELAETKGIVDGAVWCVRPDRGVAVDLETVDPTGRVWNPETCLWEEASGG